MSSVVDDRTLADETRADERAPQQSWHAWGSPVGLGIGLLSVGGFFVLLSYGLSVLDAIG